MIQSESDPSQEEKEATKIEGRLRALNPTAQILRTTQGNISPKELLNQQAFDLERVLDFEPEFLDDPDAEHQHDSSIVSTSMKLEGDVNLELLSAWIQRLISEDGANLYRYKGIISVKGKEEKFVFQGTFERED